MSAPTTAEESLMALLEAMLQLATRDVVVSRHLPKPAIKPGGYPYDIFFDLAEEEKEELSCGICWQILKETMQCDNKHKFCNSCLVVWSTTGLYANRIRCPVCRTQGVYFRNEEIDEKIEAKRVKCCVENCTWTGMAKFFNSHRHNVNGEEDTTPSTTEQLPIPSNTTTPRPRLAQASPLTLPRTGARFAGTGLTTRNSEERLGLNRGTMLSSSLQRASVDPSSSNSQETITDLTTGRSGPLPVPPVRRLTNSRITFNHSNPVNIDDNNNTSTPTTVQPSTSTNSVSEESTGNISANHTPRPPALPRPNNIRRLPRITNSINQRPRNSRFNPPEAVAPPRGSPTRQTPSGLGEIRGQLHDSRARLDNLMADFSGQLERNREEMAEFNREREQQRQEQLQEVRELGQRLGQVASELRRLLEHRRPQFLNSMSSSSSDSSDFEP